MTSDKNYRATRQKNRKIVFDDFQLDAENKETLMFAFRNEYGELFIFAKKDEKWMVTGDEFDWKYQKFPTGGKFLFSPEEQVKISFLMK